jgi:hypothetical protein
LEGLSFIVVRSLKAPKDLLRVLSTKVAKVLSRTWRLSRKAAVVFLFQGGLATFLNPTTTRPAFGHEESLQEVALNLSNSSVESEFVDGLAESERSFQLLRRSVEDLEDRFLLNVAHSFSELFDVS